MNPGPVPALHATTIVTAPASPQEKKKATKPMPWIFHRQEKGCYSNLLADLIHTDIPGYLNFEGISPYRRTHTPPHQEVSHQFQEAIISWIESGNNAETPGHLRDLHLLAVSLVGWSCYHLQICPPGLLSHPC